MIVKLLQRPSVRASVLYVLAEGGEHVRPRVAHEYAKGTRLYEPTPTQWADELESRVKAARMTRDDLPCLHVIIRTAPADRHLLDHEFGRVAEAAIERLGLTDCAWLMARHDQGLGDEHVHLIVARADAAGRRVNPWQWKNKLSDVRVEYEQRLGLRQTPRHRDRSVTRESLRDVRRRVWANRPPPMSVTARRLMRTVGESQDAAQLRRLLAQVESLAVSVGKLRRALAQLRAANAELRREQTLATTRGRAADAPTSILRSPVRDSAGMER